MLKVLVTGASGFVGRHLLRELQNHKVEIITVGRKKSDFRPDIEVKDVFDLNSSDWDQILVGIDIVIHLAWFVNHKTYRSSEMNTSCVDGSLELAKAVLKSKVKYFLGTGTCLEYGPQNVILKPTDNLMPNTTYGLAKVQLYKLLNEMFAASKIKFGWARIFFVYGEGEPETKLYSSVRRDLISGNSVYLNNPSAIYDFISVEEAVKKITYLTVNQIVGPHNICTGNGVSVLEFCKSIAADVGVPSEMIRSKLRKSDKFSLPEFIVGYNNL